MDVIDVELPDVIVSLKKDLAISQIINSNLPFTETTTIEVKFNLENLNRTDIKTLILTNTEEQTKTISSTQCVLSYTEEPRFK